MKADLKYCKLISNTDLGLDLSSDSGAGELVFYPQYCFQHSPTIGQWCHLRARDVGRLNTRAGFEGQNLYFHLNHPIRWARVAGVVVAADEFAGKRVYTLDDSSGATVECVVVMQKASAQTNMTKGGNDSNKNKQGKKGYSEMVASTAATTEPWPLAVVDGSIDVGDVLDIKGGLKPFGWDGSRKVQVQVEKAVHLRSTQQEVLFWKKVVQLRQDVLDRPWVLADRLVRRCRREAEGLLTPGEDKGKKRGGRRVRRKDGDDGSKDKHRVKSTGLEPVGRRKAARTAATTRTGPPRKSGAVSVDMAKTRVVGLQQRLRSSKTAVVSREGRYDALVL